MKAVGKEPMMYPASRAMIINRISNDFYLKYRNSIS
jgi:hypothetical protein